MTQTDAASVFEEQMERIKLVTGRRTQVALADFLDIRQSSVSDAKRRGRIPSSWLVILMRLESVNPEWILTGKGPCFIGTSLQQVGIYETGEETEERRTDEEALRRLPSRMLADELVRRIVLSQEKAFCTDNAS